MPLPSIPGAQTFIVPATAAQTFPDSALVSLRVETPQGATDLLGQTATIAFSPYSQATGKLPPVAMVPEQLPPKNIWAEVERSTLFASVLVGVVQYATLALLEWRLENAIAAAIEAEQDHAEQDAQLAAIRQQMGVA